MPKRWSHLSERMENIAIVNQFKNKLRKRTYSIITFTFRGKGVYQNAYWCEQESRRSCRWEHSNRKFFKYLKVLFFYLIKYSTKILRTFNFATIKFCYISFNKIYVAKRIDFLCSRKNYYHKVFKNVQICKINVAKTL